jgi:catechol 2,3-dioxygenase-like lactoylglutathione lyase family enzyme
VSRISSEYTPEMTMLDHVSLGVSDIARSRAFYDAALRPLGLVRIVDFRAGKGADYGAAPGSTGVEFTITEESGTVIPARGSHLCFRARDRAAVAEFHAAALGAGGRDDGSPGPRTYHEAYYAAFVLDPDGHRIEAVCHAPDAPEIAP